MPKPSPTQAAALVDLIEKRPGCHLLPVPTARAIVRHGWATRRVVRHDGAGLAVFFDLTAEGYAAVGRERPAELHPCRVENARYVEVSLYPLTGAAVALVCADCKTPHWSKAVDGAYASAADVPLDKVVALIERQGVTVTGSWFDRPTAGAWPATARRANLRRIG
ncbi:hypothetical protein [Streptomyces sp. NPDC049879]|uniref:hypothetical protein n=1 Tax=Streptomyces sp. NPDC049879 TaxID=3365598 RepID=UPI00379B1205